MADRRRISEITVSDLFDLYSHHISLRLSDRVTVIHGPNGVGKTVLLRSIANFFHGRYTALTSIRFRDLEIKLDDGIRLVILPLLPNDSDTKRQGRGIRIQLHRGEQLTEAYEYRASFGDARLAARIAAELPWLHHVTPGRWQDERSGEQLSAAQVAQRYGDRVPFRTPPSDEPEWLSNIRESASVHLIETQRLLTLPAQRGRLHPGAQEVTTTVKRYSQQLKHHVSTTLAGYANRSQALDQSFPQRMLNGSMRSLDVVDLIDKMRHLQQRRASLQHIGVLSDDFAVGPFNLDSLASLNDAQRAVMSLYVSDTEEKLNVLDDLSRRISLLLTIVNEKFRHKRLSLNMQRELVATSDAGDNLDLDSLSSGEQHELILIYDLLFRVKQNSLVMIDEPELSLHVTWQRAFLPDLLNIVDTTQFDVLLATHSPQIVGDRSDLMIKLSGD